MLVYECMKFGILWRTLRCRHQVRDLHTLFGAVKDSYLKFHSESVLPKIKQVCQYKQFKFIDQI